jgi:hypothetical protein
MLWYRQAFSGGGTPQSGCRRDLGNLFSWRESFAWCGFPGKPFIGQTRIGIEAWVWVFRQSVAERPRRENADFLVTRHP